MHMHTLRAGRKHLQHHTTLAVGSGAQKPRQVVTMFCWLALAAGRPGAIQVSADIYNGAPAPAGVFDFMVSDPEL